MTRLGAARAGSAAHGPHRGPLSLGAAARDGTIPGLILGPPAEPASPIQGPPERPAGAAAPPSSPRHWQARSRRCQAGVAAGGDRQGPSLVLSGGSPAFAAFKFEVTARRRGFNLERRRGTDAAGAVCTAGLPESPRASLYTGRDWAHPAQFHWQPAPGLRSPRPHLTRSRLRI
jgi:hypothetical protein